MKLLSRANYRIQWPRYGGLLAMAVAGATALAGDRLSKPQRLSALNFGALLVHQYEEYHDPGYFPGQFNRGILKSDSPKNYPLNTDTAMLINTVIAYPFYVAPVFLPNRKWIGLAPVIFGFGQAIGHGIIFPRLGRLPGSAYTLSPGVRASVLLHVPLGVAYIRALEANGGIDRAQWTKAAAYTAVFAPFAIGGPNLLLSNRTSPYSFSEAQMGPYASAGDSPD